MDYTLSAAINMQARNILPRWSITLLRNLIRLRNFYVTLKTSIHTRSSWRIPWASERESIGSINLGSLPRFRTFTNELRPICNCMVSVKSDSLYYLFKRCFFLSISLRQLLSQFSTHPWCCKWAQVVEYPCLGPLGRFCFAGTFCSRLSFEGSCVLLWLIMRLSCPGDRTTSWWPGWGPWRVNF